MPSGCYRPLLKRSTSQANFMCSMYDGDGNTATSVDCLMRFSHCNYAATM